jgi:multiple sugar transport system substrate-binding protein
VLKSGTGAVAAMCATGVAGKSYQRALAQESTRAQMLAIPGAGAQPTEADMQRVGELALTSDKEGAFAGQTVTFIGLNTPNLQNSQFRPLTAAWQEYTGATIEWIDVPQSEIFARVQQGIEAGTVDFDVLVGGAPWEGDILGQGLALAMPDSVKAQIELDDYVQLLQPPVGTWDGVTYRVSLDGDCHNLNYRSDLFGSQELAEQWAAEGGEGEWGVPTLWSQVQSVTQFLSGKQLDGQDTYGIIDVCAPGGGFSWYFFASRASGYVKHPDDAAWLFDVDTMRPRINSPAFVRAAQDVIDSLPYQPPDQATADLTKQFNQFLSGVGSLCHFWGDVGSNVYTNDTSVVQDKVAFSILPGSEDVFNSSTGEWETLASGPNYAPNNAYIGWGIYVMQAAEERGVSEAAWDLAAHLGGKDLSMWMSVYPSGFQPYRNSHFNAEEWASLGYPLEYAESFLASQADSYNHPNGMIEPRIPGIFQYYVEAETELAQAFAGQKSAQEALDDAAAAWEELTDQLGRESQIALYQGSLGL